MRPPDHFGIYAQAAIAESLQAIVGCYTIVIPLCQ